MTEKRSIAALVLFESDDQRLFIENLDVSTPAKVDWLRAAVVRNLAKLTRVVMVTSEEEARLMMAAHEAILRATGPNGAQLLRPPRDYVAQPDRGKDDAP
jgi:hypothetical protein